MLTKINPIIDAFRIYMDIPLIRSEQNADAPEYPYGTYKLTDLNRERPHLGVLETKEKPGDETKCIVTFRGQCDAVISLSFLSNDAKALWELVYKACDWWDDFIDEVAEPLGVRITRLSDPQDRSTQLEFEWEYKFGFDVRLSTYVVREKEVDTVDIESIAKTILMEE